jgi:hypothetical protein
MPINVDWLGDGWTYYTNEEREQMNRKQDAAGNHYVAMPANEEDRIAIASAAAASIECMVMPVVFGKALADFIRAGAIPAWAVESLEKLVDSADKSIRLDGEFRNAANN